MTIKDFFKSHKIELLDEGFIMCVDDTYTQSFQRGKFYPVINGSIRSNNTNLYSTSEVRLNKSFVPLEGTPDSLSLRDRLMIRIRIS